MIWIKSEDVILIHSKIIHSTGGIDGLRDRAGLEAAVAAPFQSFAGQDFFPSDLEKIARLGYGLAANHAFLDGSHDDTASLNMEWVSAFITSGRTGRYVHCNRRRKS